MTYDDDDIIQQQADRIEELESEVVRLYDDLHHKKKRKLKRDQVGPKSKIANPLEVSSLLLQPLRLVWWYLFWSERIEQYYRPITGNKLIPDVWKVTAFLTYFPLLVATLNSMLGSSILPASSELRFLAGLCFLPVLLGGWLVTADLQRMEDKSRSYIAAISVNVAFISMVFLSVLFGEPESLSGWSVSAILFLILIGCANAGLVHGIANLVPSPDSEQNADEFAQTIRLTYSVMLIGLSCFLAAWRMQDDKQYVIVAFLLSLISLGFVFSLVAYLIVYVISLPFSLKMTWKRNEGELVEDGLVRIIGQLIILAVLGVFNLVFFVTSLMGIFF